MNNNPEIGSIQDNTGMQAEMNPPVQVPVQPMQAPPAQIPVQGQPILMQAPPVQMPVQDQAMQAPPAQIPIQPMQAPPAQIPVQPIPVYQPVQRVNEASVQRTKKVLENTNGVSSWILFVLSLIFGAMFSGLMITNDSNGLGLTLIVIVYYCFFTPFIVTGGGKTRKSAWILLIPILLLALSATLFASLQGRFLAVLLMIVLMPMQLMLMSGCTQNKVVSFHGFIDIFKVFFGYTFANIATAFRTLGKTEGKKKGSGIKVIIGLLISIPVLIVLIALFAKADAAFAHMIKTIINFIEFDFGKLILDVMLGAVIAVFVFSGVLTLRSGHTPDKKEFKEVHWLDSTIASTVVFAAAAVYLIFVFFQIEYLFIGAKLPAGMTYAKYAHKGVAELSWAIFLTFIVCACIRVFAKRKENGKIPVVLRAALTLVTAATFIVCASAFYRIFIYIDAYGLTVTRVSAAFFIGGLTLSLVALVIAFWFDKLRIAPFVAAIVVACICGFNLINVDRVVAKVNVDRHLYQGKEFDFEYVYDDGLSCGIMPEVERLYKNSKDSETRELAEGLMAMYYYEGSWSEGGFIEPNVGLEFGDWTLDHQIAYEIYHANGSPKESSWDNFYNWYYRQFDYSWEEDYSYEYY